MNRLDRLVRTWERRRSRGEPVTADTLCPDDPPLRAALAARIRQLERFDAWTADASPAPAAVPARISKYEVRGVLGRGGMGVVYDGWNPPLERREAVKVIGPGRSDARAAARFAREAKALGRLDHPHIVGVYDAGVDGGRPYLAMKYVPGGTVADHRERLTAAGPPAIVPLVEKVARAVEYAHTHPAGGVLHGDLKPGNILLDDAGEPRVADFGLARLLEAADPEPAAAGHAAMTVELAVQTTAGGPRPGTPGYMAPEQFDPARGPVGAAADVWALGVILYELLAGRRPFEGTHRHQVAAAVGRDSPPPLAGVGRRLAAVVARCLEKDPGRRFRSAGALADALARTREPVVPLPSRRAVLFGGVGTAAAAGLGLWRGVDWGEWRYERHLAAVRRRLDAGETVTLVDIDGGVVPVFRVRTNPDATLVWAWDGRWLRVESESDGSLVELARLDPARAYSVRATAELLGVLNNKAAWGVYVNHHRATAGSQTRHRYDLAGYSELQTDPGRVEPALWQRLYAPPGPDWGPVIDLVVDTNPSGSPRLPLATPADPRLIAVELTSDRVSARLALGTDPPVVPRPIDRAERDRLATFAGRRYGDPLPGPDGRAVAVGFMARHCVCRLTRFEITPLPDEERR